MPLIGSETDVAESGRVAEMAYALFAISMVGAVLCEISLIADLTPDRHRGLEIVMSAGAVAFAGGLFAARRLTTPRFYALVGLPVATVQLAIGLYVSGDPANPAGVLHVLIALYAFYFFSRRVAVAQLAFAAATHAMALAPIASVAMAVDRWMFALGAATTAGVVVAALRDRLVAQARTDWLTGLPNRRAFHERLEQELSRLRRDRRPLALILADLDDFKSVNDRLGHEGGDDALRDAARALAASVRGHDLVARLGGDEFAVLLIGGDEQAARELADRTLDSLRKLSLTMSLGATVARSGDDSHDAEALLRAADCALYAAKRGGRSQLAFASVSDERTTAGR